MTENEVIIKLTKDESLVLFEFLARFNKEDHRELFEDQSEQKTLWIIEGQLEKILVEPFRSDYLDIIKEARNKIGMGSWRINISPAIPLYVLPGLLNLV